jgi:hypothetical protein
MPSPTNSAANITRLTGTTSETVINAGRTVLLAILPDATTTGTVTLRNSASAVGAAAVSVAAIGLLPPGKQYGPAGVVFGDGLTVQNSVTGDAVLVVWIPA